MVYKGVRRYNNVPVFYTVIDNNGVAAAFETDCVYIHNNVAEIADHLSVSFVISRFSAYVAGVKAYSVGRRIGFFDYYEPYSYSVGRCLCKTVKMSVLNLRK